MLYIQKGFKTNKVTEHEKTLMEYVKDTQQVPLQATGDTEQEKINTLKRAKANQLYFISGQMVALIRKDENLINRDYITLDYDELQGIPHDNFITSIHDALKDYEYILYPTISYTDTSPRFRLLIKTDRPIIQSEYKSTIRHVADRLPYKIDTSSGTWSQLQGLPIKTELNKHIEIIINQGKGYPPQQPTEQEKINNGRTTTRHHRETPTNQTIPHEKAISMMQDYVKNNHDELEGYTNSLSCISTIAKATIENEISEQTAIDCLKILSMDNDNWYIENKAKFTDFMNGVYEPRTSYTFMYHFSKKEVKSVKQLHHKLQWIGETVRVDNAKVNENTGEIKIKPLSNKTIAKIIVKNTIPILINTYIKDRNPLAFYNLDSGIYDISERFFKQLCYAVEPSIKEQYTKDIKSQIINNPFLQVDTKELTNNENLTVCKNGIFNRTTKQLMEFTPNYVFLSKIDTNYIENAQEPIFEDWSLSSWIKELSNHDASKEKLLYQMFQRVVTPQGSNVAFFLYSEKGNTGKSTIEQLCMEFVGKENYTALTLKELEERFKPSQIVGKSLVIGDDNNPKDFNETSETFKRLVTGEPMNIEQKGKDSYSIQLTVTVIQSMNGIPRFKDTTHGMLRRLRIIHFNKSFTGAEDNLNVKRKYINDKRLHEFILFKALNSPLERVVETEETKNIVNDIKLINDNIYNFFEEKASKLKSERIPIDFLFKLYLEFCREENYKPKGKTTFIRDITPHMQTLGFFYDATRTRYPYPYFNMDDIKENGIEWAYNYEKHAKKYTRMFYKQ